MRVLGICLIALPFIFIILCGLIFDTADFLAGMFDLGLILLPMAAGAYLLARSN